LPAVTDAGLGNLKPLANLTYLNLYGESAELMKKADVEKK
jgi:hypothetical protein